MTDNQNKKTMISLVTSLMAMALSMAISFFLSPYIVENFGEEANGFTQLANNFVNYATLITVALNSMAGRFITISYHRKDYELCNKYYSSVIIGNVVIIAVLLLPAVYCVARLDALIQIETAVVSHVKILFALVFGNFFLQQVNGILTIAIYVKNVQYIQNTVNMLRTLINAVGLIAIFAAMTPRIFYVSLVGFVLSLITIPIFYVVKRKILPEIKFSIKSFDIKTIWQMISSGIWNTVNQCGNLLMTGFDLLLSNWFISPVQMGVLSVAKTIPNCIIQLAGTVNTTFSPNLTIAYAANDKQRIIGSLRYAMKCSSILVAIPIMVITVYGNSFYSLWVPSIDANELTVLSFLSCAAFVPFAGPQVLYNVYTTANKLKVNALSVLIGGVVNIAAVYLLLRYTDLGLIAVAGVSSLVSILRNLLVTVPYTARILDLKWYTFYSDVLVSLVCCAMSGVACYICQKLIVPTSWITFIASAAVACIISAALMVLVLLNKNEKKQIIKKILRK